MPSFALIDWQRVENAGAVTAASKGTTVTAAGSTNTKGSYAQLIAATAFPAQKLVLMFDTPSNSARDFLVDIAIGAGGSETIIISNLLVSTPNDTTFMGGSFTFDIRIPAGTRLSARCQCTSSSSTLRASALLFAHGFGNPGTLSIVDTYGVNSSGASAGTTIDPGGTINTKGSYVQLTAAVARPTRWLTIVTGSLLNTVATTCSWLVDVAVGAAASEVVILPNIAYFLGSSVDGIEPQTYRFPVNVPSGTRLAVRAQCSINDATDRLFAVSLLGEG